MLRPSGQTDGDGRAAIAGAIHADVAVMLVGDGVDRGQTVRVTDSVNGRSISSSRRRFAGDIKVSLRGRWLERRAPVIFYLVLHAVDDARIELRWRAREKNCSETSTRIESSTTRMRLWRSFSPS